MRPRVRSGVRPPTVGPRGGAGDSGAAPYWRPSFHLPTPADPEYRWTFKTWIDHHWEDYSGKKQRIEDERTMTVIASTEAAAKVKIEAAVPPLPKSDSGYQKQAYTRQWELQGAIEEVTP